MTKHDPRLTGRAGTRAGDATAPLAQSGPLAGAANTAPEPDAVTTACILLSPLMTTHDVCAVFGRTSRTIRNWVRAGHLRPVRVGRAVFLRREEVEQLASGKPACEQEDEPQSPGLSGPE